MGIFGFFKRNDQRKEEKKLNTIKLKDLNSRRAFREFNAKGVTMDNRQSLLNTITRKYGLEGINKIELISEPDNKYDLNAIKIVFEGIGHLGYVPKDIAEDIGNLLKRNTYDIKWNIDFFENEKNEDIAYMEIRLYPQK